MSTRPLAMALVGWLLSAPGSHAETAVVVTQSPRRSGSLANSHELYTEGSRVCVIRAPFAPDHLRVLSEGLVAAGAPVLDYDGRQVFFCGKASVTSDWQVFQCDPERGRPRVLTHMPDGAVQPALLPDGTLLFVSPAPGDHRLQAPQIYALAPGGQPRQLTFTAAGATDPTVLRDGRILFVASQPSLEPDHRGLALYTINNDGTEITPFAGQHDQPAILARPRELRDKRIVFLTSKPDSAGLTMKAEQVRMTRPFSSRAELLPGSQRPISSVEPLGESNLLVCAQVPSSQNGGCGWDCFLLEARASGLGQPLLADARWDTIEALELAASPKPMGRISTMEPQKRTGEILCLDVNDSTLRGADHEVPKAVKIRILAQTKNLGPRVLGEVPVQPDGSFMAEVPADTLLGFEALNEQGAVLRRDPPLMWVRSGENRACVGCHAAHNRAPHNHRPLAVREPIPSFSLSAEQTLAQKRK